MLTIPAALLHVPQAPGLVDQLAELSSKGCRIVRLLELLVAAAMDQLPKHPQFEQLLQSLVARVQMGEQSQLAAECGLAREDGRTSLLAWLGLGIVRVRACEPMPWCMQGVLASAQHTNQPTNHSHALLCPGDAGRLLAERVLQRAAATDEQPGDEAAAAQRALHLRLLRSLDQRCPEALDAAVTAVLPAQQQGQEGQQQKGGSGGGQQEERRQRMLALLSEAFEGTARCVMLEAGTTLLAAAEAPAVGMRQMVSASARPARSHQSRCSAVPAPACCVLNKPVPSDAVHDPWLLCSARCLQAVQRLDELAAAAAPGSEAAAAAGTALLRRLHDDSPAVVQAVLDASSLLRLPPAAVFDGLAACFERAMQLVSLVIHGMSTGDPWRWTFHQWNVTLRWRGLSFRRLQSCLHCAR